MGITLLLVSVSPAPLDPFVTRHLRSSPLGLPQLRSPKHTTGSFQSGFVPGQGLGASSERNRPVFVAGSPTHPHRPGEPEALQGQKRLSLGFCFVCLVGFTLGAWHILGTKEMFSEEWGHRRMAGQQGLALAGGQPKPGNG